MDSGVAQSGRLGFLDAAATAGTILTSVFAALAMAVAPLPVVSRGAFVIVTIGAVQIPAGGTRVAMLVTAPTGVVLVVSSVAAKVPPEQVASEIVTVGGSV